MINFYWKGVVTVRIKPMLARFQSTIGRDDLIEQMVLVPESRIAAEKKKQTEQSLNFIVSYNGSRKSHTALDIALCIAHQTQLATKKQVKVHAVYVLDNYEELHSSQEIYDPGINESLLEYQICELSNSIRTPVLTQAKVSSVTLTAFQQAELILWQARSLAQEWQDNFQVHLRFGCVADELKKVAESENADILFLGCDSMNHPLIQSLDSNIPFAVLGIPHCLEN